MAEVAHAADLPVANTYAALADVARLGGAFALPQRPLRYRAVPPKDWLTQLAEGLAEDARQAAARIPFEEADPEPAPELIGWRRLRSLLLTGIEEAQDLIVAHLPRSLLPDVSPALRRAGTRGAQICLLLTSDDEDAARTPAGRPTGWIVASEDAPRPGALWVFDRRWLLHHRGRGPQARGSRILDPVAAEGMAEGLLARIALAAGLPTEDPIRRRLARLLEDR